VNTDVHPSAPFLRGAVQRYAAAVAATIAALVVSGALTPFAGASIPYLALLPALTFASLYCGIGPSALATVIAFFGIKYWFTTPVRSFSVPDAPQAVSLMAFLMASSLVLVFGEMHRRNKENLRRSQEDLETQVQERTAELATANQELHALTARLLQLQDEERRRIARELHDSVGQSLAALNMNLSSLGAHLERLASAANLVSDSTALVNEVTKDIRTISHLLHPPLLDETGLGSALQWYIEGFTERSKIRVELQLPDNLDRLPRDLETAIFRLVQECLTNIHRHSGSSVAKIVIARSKNDVRVEVEDHGKGIPPERKPQFLTNGKSGVGIRGMRERIHQLGGVLEISSEGIGRGTTVVAQLPVENSRVSAIVAGASSLLC
jgi:signal transduction histidine kinase